MCHKKRNKKMSKDNYGDGPMNLDEDFYGNPILSGYKKYKSFKDSWGNTLHDTGERTIDGDVIWIDDDGNLEI